jgi:transcriptional regulator with XRE-family HTH domain
LELIKQKGLSPSQFADEIGIQRSGISHLISGRNKPSLEFIMKILARFPETDLGWLIQGDDKPVGNGGEKTVVKGDEKPVGKDEKLIPPISSVQNSLFDAPEMAETLVIPKPEKKKVKAETEKVETEKAEAENAETEKAIEKIVIFYSDRSFREYTPD